MRKPHHRAGAPEPRLRGRAPAARENTLPFDTRAERAVSIAGAYSRMHIAEWRGYGMLAGIGFFAAVVAYQVIEDAFKGPADVPVSTYLSVTPAGGTLTGVRLKMKAVDLRRVRANARSVATGLVEPVGDDTIGYHLDDDELTLVRVIEVTRDSSAADSVFTARVASLREAGRGVDCREAPGFTREWKDGTYTAATGEIVRVVLSGTRVTTSVAWGDQDQPPVTTQSWCP